MSRWLNKGRSRSRRKYCKWKTSQLLYQATLLFTDCIVRGAIESRWGSIWSQAVVQALIYPVPSYTAAKPHSSFLLSALRAFVHGVSSAQSIPPPTSPVKLLHILQDLAQLPLYVKAPSIPAVSIRLPFRSVSRHYQIAPGVGRGDSTPGWKPLP